MDSENEHSLRVTILGCGSSGGVPRPGGEDGEGDWGVCDRNEPKNRRSRCSVLVERPAPDAGFENRREVTSVLIDTSPDMRTQLLAARCARIDHVLITHDHADQTHGLDDLRAFAIAMRQRVPVYIDRHTADWTVKRFAYCFEQLEGSWYPPILEERAMPAYGEAFTLDGPAGPIEAKAFLQRHGPVDSLGFRIGAMAYSSDVSDLPEESFEILEGVDLWIVDALQRKPHGTHAHLEKTLGWIERVKPRRAILTNMHNTMDYGALIDELPPHITPAYDGMVINF